MSRSKILSLEALAAICAEARRLGKRVVFCHGAFDLLHPGHVAHLGEARNMGDLLAVTVTADRHILKGPGRPAYNEAERMAMLAALSCVDFVALLDDPTALPALKAVVPSIFCRGPDYAERKAEGIWGQELALARELGCDVRFTTAPAKSTSHLINEYLPSALSPETQAYLKDFRAHHSLTEVMDWLEKARACRVQVMGERIVDEYITVKAAGKSPHSEAITYVPTGEQESYGGGATIVREHACAVADEVFSDYLSYSETVKTRFITSSGHTVFQLASGGCHSWPIAKIRAVDMFLMADFGHGVIPGGREADRIADAAPWLALTVQTNGLNYGFNLINKWPRANYVVLDEEELRLSWSDKVTPLEDLAGRELRRMGARVFVVTLGAQGCLLCDTDGAIRAPALAVKAVDMVGAGDAFLGVTAPLAWAGAPKEVIGLVGSVAAAIKVGKQGNVPVERRELRRWLQGLLA